MPFHINHIIIVPAVFILPGIAGIKSVFCGVSDIEHGSVKSAGSKKRIYQNKEQNDRQNEREYAQYQYPDQKKTQKTDKIYSMAVHDCIKSFRFVPLTVSRFCCFSSFSAVFFDFNLCKGKNDVILWNKSVK